jgi:hypothetical protein
MAIRRIADHISIVLMPRETGAAEMRRLAQLLTVFAKCRGTTASIWTSKARAVYLDSAENFLRRWSLARESADDEQQALSYLIWAQKSDGMPGK